MAALTARLNASESLGVKGMYCVRAITTVRFCGQIVKPVLAAPPQIVFADDGRRVDRIRRHPHAKAQAEAQAFVGHVSGRAS